MLIRYRHASASSATLLVLVSVVVLAQEPPARPTPVETHELTIDRQVEIAQSIADHEAVAQRFDQEAAQFDRQAAEHERLAEHYKRGLGFGPKENSASLASHCDRLAKNLKASATEAREMARMHRDIAHKLVR